MYLIDQQVQITEADWAVDDIERLLCITTTNDNLQAFICARDTVLSGLQAPPENAMLEALPLRQFRGCETMGQDLAYYDRLSPDSPDESYDYLLRYCRRVIERNRFPWVLSELTKSISQGGRALVARGKGKGGDEGQDEKSKGSSNKKDNGG